MRDRDKSPDSVEYKSSYERIGKLEDQLRLLGFGMPLATRHQNKFEVLDPEEKETPPSPKEENENEGYWTRVAKKRARNERSKIAPHRLYTQEECDVFAKLVSAWFMYYTGKQWDFVITPESQPYISPFDACLDRERVVSTLFNYRPNWIECFGGSGLDTAAAMFGCYPKHVYISEWFNGDAKEEQKQFRIMKENLTKFCNLFDEFDQNNPESPQLHMYNLPSTDFLAQIPAKISIDILYLDPNWFIGGPNNERQRSPEELMTHIQYHAIRPLTKMGRYPQCVILKTRWPAELVWKFAKKYVGEDYYPKYSIEATPYRTHVDEQAAYEEGEVQGRFYWAIIVHGDLETLHWRKSEAYKKIFITRESFYVEKKYLVSPQIPAYSDSVKRPPVSTRTSGDDLIHIVPPARHGGRQTAVQQARRKSRK